MVHLHLQRRTRVQTRIQIPNLMATLHYAEHVHIAENQTRIPTPYFCVGEESESESEPKSVCGNVNEPSAVFNLHLPTRHWQTDLLCGQEILFSIRPQ